MTRPNLLAVKKRIISLPQGRLKALLLEHFNDAAQTTSALFSAEPHMHLSLEALPQERGLPKASAIAIAFAYASPEVLEIVSTELFQMKPEAALDLINQTFENTDGLYQLYMATSAKGRLKLSTWLAELSSLQVMQAFAGKKDLLGNYPTLSSRIHAIEILAFGELASVDLLVLALSKLNQEQLFTLFQTTTFPKARFTGLIELMKQLAARVQVDPDAEEKTCLILDLVNKFSPQQIQQLFWGEEREHLLQHLKAFSPKVRQKGLSLLGRLPDAVIEPLISLDKHSFMVPNEAIKSPHYQEDFEKVMIQYMTLLNRSKPLQAYLVNNSSFLQQLAQHECFKAMIHYLEQIPFTSKQRFSNKMVSEESQKNLNALLSGHELFHQLKRLDSDKSICETIDSLHPDVFHACWSDQKTFAHLAILARKSQVLEHLIDHGIDPNAEDLDGRTPLDYAIEYQEKEAILVLAQCPDTQFEPRHLLALIDFLTVAELKAVMDYLFHQNKHDTALLLQNTLIQFPLKSPKKRALKQWLDTAQQKAQYTQALQEYCIREEDSYSFLLSYTTQKLVPEALQEAISGFVSKNLTLLASEDDAQTKESARLQLIAFLFSIPIQSSTACLRAMELDEAQRTQLDLVLCYALIKPAIYLHLSTAEFCLVLNALYEKRSTYQNIFILLSEQAELTRIAIPILNVLSRRLPLHVLLNCCQNRRHPSLLVLTLEKALNEEPPNEEILRDLFQALIAELNLFNGDPSPLSDEMLVQMLQLIEHKALKAHVNHYLNEQGLIIKQRLRNLFAHFSPQQPLLLQSLHADLLMESAKETEALVEQALPQYISVLPLEALQPLVIHHQEALHPHFLEQEESPQLKPKVEQLHRQVSQGVMQHADLNLVFPAFIEWLMGFGHTLQYTGYATSLTALIPQAHPNTLNQVSEQIALLTQEALRGYVLLEKLYRLIHNTLYVKDLVQFFAEIHAQELSGFIQLTVLSKQLGVHNFILECQEHLLDGDDEDSEPILDDNQEVSKWLKPRLASMLDYVKHLFSMQALISGLSIPEVEPHLRLRPLNDLMHAPHAHLTTEAMHQLALSYHSILSEDLDSADAAEFLQILNSWFQGADAQQQKDLLVRLTEPYVLLLLDHCLSGINCEDEEQAQYCQSLMTSICLRTTFENKHRWQYIKHHLGQQNLNILGSQELQTIAETVLREKANMADLTIDGVWIQRLVTSPHFMAKADVPSVKQLITRYRALSLLLKESEFSQLTRFLNQRTPPAEEANPRNPRGDAVRMEQLQEKRERLLTFRADDAERELWHHLEMACSDLRPQDPMVADQALQTCNVYNQDGIAGLRQDVLFRMADSLYARMTRGKGDLGMAQSPFLSWIERNIPHQNFLQSELGRKSKVILYNIDLEKIGYVNENNQAFAFSEDDEAAIPLLSLPNIAPGMVLYDEDLRRLGTLTLEGRLQSDNVFRQSTSALLVAQMPVEKLAKSPAALSLLLQDIFKENAVQELYQKAGTPEKHLWLHQQIVAKLLTWRGGLSETSIRALVDALPFNALVNILDQCKQIDTCGALFKTMFLHRDQRKKLLEEGYTSEIKNFLNRQPNVDYLFADFLALHYEAPWFRQGFLLFAKHARHKPYQDLLSDALFLLNDRVTTGQMKREVYDEILTKLMARESLAESILRDFLQDKGKTSLAKAHTRYTDNLVDFFEKSHVLPVIQQLNNELSPQSTARYRLVLTAFNAQQSRLLPRFEPRLSRKYAWHQTEIESMGRFLNQHLSYYPMPKAHEHVVGIRLLNDLVFRAANFGQTSLFYTRANRFDPSMATRQLNRQEVLHQVSRFYLIRMTEEVFEKIAQQVKEWFEDKEEHLQRQLKNYLEHNEALIDWKKIAKESFAGTTQEKLPIMAAFLLNYAGEQEVLAELLTHFLTSPDVISNPFNSHTLSQLMCHYPHREVSHVIYKTYATLAQKDPTLIDEVVLQHMIYFHVKAHINDNKSRHPSECALQFLIHLGKTKQYLLAHQCALLLSKQTEDHSPMYLQKFEQAVTQARVEHSLKNHVGAWYFDLIKSIKRWWNYDKGWEEQPDKVISLCDEEITYCNPEKEIEVIHSTARSGQIMDQQMEVAENIRHHNKKIRGHRFFNAAQVMPAASPKAKQESPIAAAASEPAHSQLALQNGG